MADLGDEWTLSSNDAITISLVDDSGTSDPFKPKFTYPLFGDQELIYGYKNLRVNLKFDATTLLPYVGALYDRKNQVVDVIDPVKVLKSKLPKSTLDDEGQWNTARRKETLKFKLPGEQVGNVLKDNDDFEYQVRLVTLKDLELHHRLRIFILFFIEAGSYLDEADDRWQFYLLYRTDSDHPKFAGFSSVYPYFWYKDSATHDKMTTQWPIRMRISQFVILPPYQRRNLGKQLYSTLFNRFLEDQRVREITVEDPSEQFDDLRDRCDLERLAKLGVWSQPKFKNARTVDSVWIEKTREKQKMAPRQFSRCVEMALLYQHADEQPSKAYKLFVKRRLFIRNREALLDLNKGDRIAKLEEVFAQVVNDYHRILEPVDFAEDAKGKKRAHSEIED